MLPQVEWILRSPAAKEGWIPLHGLNVGSSFITQEEAMYESPVETRESPRCPPPLDRVLTSLETSRGKRSSLLLKVTMPDSSLKLIGIPISLCQIEKMA